MDQSAAPPAHRPAQPAHPPAQLRSTRLKTYGICFLTGLLLGLVPLGIRLMQTQGDRDALQQQLRLANLEMNLSAAAVMTRHGDYTAARDAASRYFSDARQAIDSDDDTLTAAQRAHLESALASRDALISLLSRGDPAGAERSTAMYVAHRAAFPR